MRRFSLGIVATSEPFRGDSRRVRIFEAKCVKPGVGNIAGIVLRLQLLGQLIENAIDIYIAFRRN